jgi:hypothetical protein
MFCSSCGSRLTEGAVFCSGCGMKKAGVTTGAASGNWPAPTVTSAAVSYYRVTSVVIYTNRMPVRVIGDLKRHQEEYRKAQLWTALLGWWGFPFGIIWTMSSLVKNSNQLKSVKELLTSGKKGAGWLPDPSGKYEERYWDGLSWSDKVRSAEVDLH